MVIIAHYQLEVNLFGKIICNSLEEPICPVCKSQLKYRDRRWRIMRKEGHDESWIQIRRLYCEHCNRLHNELPDCLSPYKHYSADIIEGAVDGIVTADDEDSEDYPCEMTMERWKKWIEHNQLFIEGFLRMIGFNIFGLGVDFLSSTENMLDNIRIFFQANNLSWLGFINRVIYNQAGYLDPFPKAQAP